MVRVAGKPILGHILDVLVEGLIDEVAVVVGVMREHAIEYVDDEYGSVGVKRVDDPSSYGVVGPYAIVGEDSELYDINLAETFVGASTTVTGTPTRLNVGDSSELDL